MFYIDTVPTNHNKATEEKMSSGALDDNEKELLKKGLMEIFTVHNNLHIELKAHGHRKDGSHEEICTKHAIAAATAANALANLDLSASYYAT